MGCLPLSTARPLGALPGGPPFWVPDGRPQSQACSLPCRGPRQGRPSIPKAPVGAPGPALCLGCDRCGWREGPCVPPGVREWSRPQPPCGGCPQWTVGHCPQKKAHLVGATEGKGHSQGRAGAAGSLRTLRSQRPQSALSLPSSTHLLSGVLVPCQQGTA